MASLLGGHTLRQAVTAHSPVSQRGVQLRFPSFLKRSGEMHEVVKQKNYRNALLDGEKHFAKG